MMKYLTVLILFTISFLVFSKDENTPKIIVLRQSSLDGLSREEGVNLRRSSLEAILLAKKFELSLADLKKDELGKDKVWYLFQTEVVKTTNSEWNMKYELIEMPSGNIINRVIEKRVLGQQLQYRGRINSLKLIFGKYVNESTGALEKEIVIPLDQYVEVNEKKPDEESNKNELPSDVPVSVNLILEEEKASPKMDLKEEEVSKNKENEAEKPKVGKKNLANSSLNNQVTISNFSSPNIDLAKEPYKPEEIKISNFVRSFSYSLGLEKETIDSSLVFTSNETVNTEISLSRLMLRLSMNSSDDVNGNYIKHHLGLSKTVGDNEYKVGPKLSLGSSYHYELLERRLRFGANAELERSGYANLRSRGEGIQAITSTILYGGVGCQFLFELGKYPSMLSLGFKRSFWGNSDIADGGESAIVDGSKTELSFKSLVYGMWGFNLVAETGTINSAVSTKLDNKHSMMAIYVVYN